MNTSRITFVQILAIGLIFAGAAVAWFTLGSALTLRTAQSASELEQSVKSGWGPPLVQEHPVAWYLSPTGDRGRKMLHPQASSIAVDLVYEPKQKGLLWYRTYGAGFSAVYEFENPTPIAQTIYVSFRLPDKGSSFTDFSLRIGENEPTARSPTDGEITEAVVLNAHETTELRVAYQTRGTNEWRYQLAGLERVRNFELNMTTDFGEIDFPAGVGSPTVREREEGGWALAWNYPDVIGPQSAGMAMPNVLNAGPVASRIAFFAPVSLLFFFAVLLILGTVRGINLHPMNYFFLAAGCFAFQLLFAYLVDLLPIGWSFGISAGVSLLLVNGYLGLVGGREILVVSLPAQAAYMVLFSYSFFFDGLSGITIAIGAVITLAILMATTAKIDWARKFSKPEKSSPPPPVPQNV